MMKRYLFLVSAISLAAQGCASPKPLETASSEQIQTRTPSPSRDDARRESSPVAIGCRLTDGTGTVLFEGGSTLDYDRELTLGKNDPEAHFSIDISRAQTSGDGILLHILVKESRGTKSRVWQPSVLLKPGTTGEVVVDLGDGEKRKLELSANAPT